MVMVQGTCGRWFRDSLPLVLLLHGGFRTLALQDEFALFVHVSLHAGKGMCSHLAQVRIQALLFLTLIYTTVHMYTTLVLLVRVLPKKQNFLIYWCWFIGYRHSYWTHSL